jgi:trimeric autotransporter adhesin
MKKCLMIVFALALIVQVQAVPSDTCNQNTWVTNGPVNAIVVAGGKVYIGGSFSRVGPFVNGSFDSAHSVIRNNIAALDARTGVATDWSPNADNPVYALAVSGGIVFAGGEFDSIGGQERNWFAALDTETGKALAWSFNADNAVLTLAVSGTTVYVGGYFDSIGGQVRGGVAAIDAKTGNVTSWAPDFSNWPVLNALAVNGATVYVGGGFNSVDGQSRSNLAALDATTGNVLPWNPNADGEVNSLVVSGAAVFVGGDFDSIGGQSRPYVADLDATTGNPLPWNPNAWGLGAIIGSMEIMPVVSPPSVNSLAISGSTIFLGGDFDGIGGQKQNSIAGLDATTGNAIQWDPLLRPENDEPWNSTFGCRYAIIYSIAMNGTTVYVGGHFDSIGQGPSHPYFAQFDSAGNSPVLSPISESSLARNSGLQIVDSRFGTGALVKIAYSLAKAENVSLRLYNINGQMLSELVNGYQDAGNHTMNLQKGNLAAGAYLVVLRAGDFHQEKMISLMK